MEKHDIERRERVSAARWASRNEWLHRYLDSQGYINYEDTWSDNRTIGIHRLLAISEFGIEAVKDKVVHHKNRIPWDNRPDNIEIMTTEEHSCHHQEQGHLGPK